MKKIKKCKYCQADVAKNAKKCPKCGGKLGIGWLAKTFIIIGIVLLCLIGCTVSCSKSVSDAFSEYDDVNGTKTFNVGDTFESKYIKVTLDSTNLNYTNYSEYSEPSSENKVVQFVFTAENIGEDNQTFDYTDFNCYADGETMQQFYGTDDSGLESGGTISAGKTATVPVYCEVPKDATKVTVEFKPLLADNNYEFIAK